MFDLYYQNLDFGNYQNLDIDYQKFDLYYQNLDFNYHNLVFDYQQNLDFNYQSLTCIIKI